MISPQSVRMTKPRILVVEDDPACAEGLQEVLEECGYTTVWAKAPHEAVEAIGREERIGVVILDLRLPELDGVRLLSKLRAAAAGGRGASLQAILCSGNADPRDLDSAMRSGFSAFIPKPIARTDLLNAVADSVRRYSKSEQDRASRDGLLNRFRKLEDSFGGLAREVASMSNLPLAEALGKQEDSGNPHPALDKAWHAVQCRRLMHEARQTDALLTRLQIEDAEWRLLLSLFEAELEGKEISATSLALAAGASASAGLRRVAALTQRGLVFRAEDRSDARRALVELTESGRKLCRNALESIAAMQAAS